jgi:hypothetical protein
MKKAASISAKPSQSEGFTKVEKTAPKLSPNARVGIREADSARAKVAQKASNVRFGV